MLIYKPIRNFIPSSPEVHYTGLILKTIVTSLCVPIFCQILVLYETILSYKDPDEEG